ncbi:hypothetical protein [Streptomyces uncialis]|uniref:hypothetical protein n=1 Tax=Streptomyces uncialis TaxID=1048205 RepID=UPI0038698C94|nr:hypothetical protein OG924_00065 [Streptomyces uncialis]WTE15347.1 hypothetical protein OG924_36935 [Streptomyces uncialis]
MLDPEVEMPIESNTTAYVLWRALGEAVATHPLPPRPVREDTAVALLSVQDTSDVLLRTRIPIPWNRPSEAHLAQRLAPLLPRLAETFRGLDGLAPLFMTVSVGWADGVIPLDERLASGLVTLARQAVATGSGVYGDHLAGACGHCAGTGRAAASGRSQAGTEPVRRRPAPATGDPDRGVRDIAGHGTGGYSASSLRAPAGMSRTHR